MTTDAVHHTPKRTIRSAALAGIGSLLDLRGAATYRTVSSLMRQGRPKTSVKGSFSAAMRRRPL